MRHQLTQRLATSVGGLLIAAAVVFALLANAAGDDRLERVLALDGDVAHGRALYDELATPTCAECHSLADVGAESRIASDLDEFQPTARETAASLLSEAIAGHDRYDYHDTLSNQDLADLAEYLEQVAGQDDGGD